MKVAILTYHRVSTRKGNDFPVTRRNFERQMNFIASSGYRVITMADLISSLRMKVSLAGKIAVLTFDDGFQDTCEAVCGLLESHNFPATFFLIPGGMGQTATWLTEQHRLMDWHDARRLAGQGFTIGSHSLTHRPLPKLLAGEARVELTKSKLILQDELGVEVSFFAYPYGAWDARMRDLVVEAGYTGACTTHSGFNDIESDCFALRRLDISGEYSLPTFKRSLTFGENQMPLSREIGYYSRRLLSVLGSTGAKHGS